MPYDRSGVEPDLHVDFKMGRDLWDALNAYCEERGARRAHAVRALLSSALRESGHLPKLKEPEDAAELEDAFGYPWPAAPGPAPSLLPWWSRDPERPTWARLLRAMEEETDTPLARIAGRFGVSSVQASRVFRRYDRWRRGEDQGARRSLESAPRDLSR